MPDASRDAPSWPSGGGTKYGDSLLAAQPGSQGGGTGSRSAALGRLVPDADYAALPAFCRSQLTADQLEASLSQLMQLVGCRYGD